MKKDNSDLLAEIKNVLDMMKKKIAINKMSFNEFVSCYIIMKKYISLGAKDYFPYATLLFNAIVIIKSRNDQELFNSCKADLEKIITGEQSKSIKKR